MDNAIDCINHYPLDSIGVDFVNAYPLDSDVSIADMRITVMIVYVFLPLSRSLKCDLILFTLPSYSVITLSTTGAHKLSRLETDVSVLRPRANSLFILSL